MSDPFDVGRQIALGKGNKSASSQVIRTVAKYDFKAVKEKDLSFKEGDEIIIEKKRENGWWVGYCKGKRGYFPHNYVEERKGE